MAEMRVQPMKTVVQPLQQQLQMLETREMAEMRVQTVQPMQQIQMREILTRPRRTVTDEDK
jgi:hypothetical protein